MLFKMNGDIEVVISIHFVLQRASCLTTFPVAVQRTWLLDSNQITKWPQMLGMSVVNQIPSLKSHANNRQRNVYVKLALVV
jgi:hypothetical protein